MKAGDLVIYTNGDRAEIGKIKRITPDNMSAFVWYHTGETAALTWLHDLTPITNAYTITATDLGGDEGREVGK